MIDTIGLGSRRTAPRRKLGFVAVAVLSMSASSLAHAFTYPIVCDNTLVGQISVDAFDGGVTGGFTSVVGMPPSLDAAAAMCNEDHFNWFQVVISDNDPPNAVDGGSLFPPYIDPPSGGYGVPDLHWADNLPWLWDEGADPPANTPGFEDGLYNIEDVLLDVSPVDGAPDTLLFDDVPDGPVGTQLAFQTWLVSLNADGTLHEFHEGFEWTWQRNQAGGPGIVAIASQPLTVFQGMALYSQLVLPEPSSLAMAVLGLGAFALRRRSHPR
jgi:MYXO-CTERM domain-containing protein